jgi:hypothetical protein
MPSLNERLVLIHFRKLQSFIKYESLIKFSISSINASIDSLPGDYLFFVADSKTSHYFSKTYEEHLNKINELGLNK